MTDPREVEALAHEWEDAVRHGHTDAPMIAEDSVRALHRLLKAGEACATALRAIVAENAELKQQATDILLEQVGVESFTATAEGMIGRLRGGPLALIMAEAFARDLGDAPNYVECQLTTKAGQFITVTIQRHPGQTPHQMREAAERERDALTAQLAAARADVERLDWLEREACHQVRLVTGDGAAFITRWGRRYSAWSASNLRAAIDAAKGGYHA